MSIKSAEILCVGTELLLGDIINTNAAFLSKELASLGISQYRQSVVGDNAERLEYAVKQALSECELLIVTGGLGPTYDDITKETVAKVLDKKLIFDKSTYEKIKEYFDSRGRKMSDNNRKQAMIIEGSVILENDMGTAPGIYCKEKNKAVILLPGPPFEMQPIWKNKAKPILSKQCDKVFLSRNINIVGMGESMVASKLCNIMENAVNPTVAPYCSAGEVRLRITASADTKEEALQLCNDKIREIAASEVSSYIYGIDTTLPEALVKVLKKKNLKFTCAESCTGGLIAKSITDVAGTSEVFDGGVVSYSGEVKCKLLDVSESCLEKYGAVSHQVAVMMARGVKELMHADVSVAVTGLAGPGGGTEEKPVGLVYISVSYKGNDTVNKYMFGDHLSREKIRELAMVNALADVLRAIK